MVSRGLVSLMYVTTGTQSHNISISHSFKWLFLETICKQCHGCDLHFTTQVITPGYTAVPSCHGSALSPSWIFSHYKEHFPSLQELALMVGAASPGDGITLQPMGLQQGRISAGLPPAEVPKYQF